MHVEDSGPVGISERGVATLEQQVLRAPLEGVILRYGKLYGPGNGFDSRAADGPVHVDAAAHAARLVLTRGAPGIYNIAEMEGGVSSDKAIKALGGSRVLEFKLHRTHPCIDINYSPSILTPRCQ